MKKILLAIFIMVAPVVVPFVYSQDRYVAIKGTNTIVLTDEECDGGIGLRSHATIDKVSYEGCYFISENMYIILRDTNTKKVYAFPFVIFDKINHV